MLRQEITKESNSNNEDEILYRNFINALKSKTTKADYTRRLKYLLEFLGSSDGKYSVLIDPDKDKKMMEKCFL